MLRVCVIMMIILYPNLHSIIGLSIHTHAHTQKKELGLIFYKDSFILIASLHT